MHRTWNDARNGGGAALYLQRDGRFTPAPADLLGAPEGRWTLAIGTGDFDGDGYTDLYFANDFGPDRLLHNRSKPGRLHFTLLEGEKGLTTPSSKVVGRDSFKGMGADIGDLNGDGWPDILVSNIAAEYALEESHFAFISTGQVDRMKQGVAPYVDRSEPLGLARSDWSWDIKLGDFDNDSHPEVIQATGFLKGQVGRWPELHELAMGNDELLADPRAWPALQPGSDLSGHAPNPFYTLAPNGRFVNIAAELKLDQPQVSRGIAIADVDGDGDLDFAVANQWEPSSFYRNDCRHCGPSLTLDLRLPVAGGGGSLPAVLPGHVAEGRPAVGACVKVSLPDGRVLVSQVDGGNGHGGRRSPTLHFGLGELPNDVVLPVELRWRDGHGEIRLHTLHLRPGQYTVRLGTAPDNV
jgi:hypothetical protein